MNVDTDSLEKLNLLTRDATERAGNALETTIDESTQVGATKIRLVDYEDIVTDLLGASEVCLKFDLQGPLSGTVLLIVDAAGLGRIDAYAGTDGETDEAALLDIAGTMMQGFTIDWEANLGDDLRVVDPEYVDDPSVSDFDFESVATESVSAPVFQSRIHWLHDPGAVTLYLVPDADSMERLLAIEDVDADDTVDAGTSDAGSASDDSDESAGGDGDQADDSFADDEDDPFADDEDDSFGTDSDAEGDDESPFGGDDTDDDSPFGGDDADDDSPFGGDDDSASDDSPFGGEDSPFGGGDDGDDGESLDMDDDFSFGDDDGETTSIPLDKLSVFSDLTKEGTVAAAERVTQMTGIDIDTEIAGVSFTPVDDISGQVKGNDYVGTTMEFEGTPSGYLVILFRASSAANVAEEMLPMEPDGEGLTDMHKSAIEELCNIMTSGFLDGWANVLQTSVEHTPPEYVDDMDLALVEIVTDQLGPFQTHAYTIESRMETDDIEFDCEIHALPDESDLGAAVEDLALDRKDQTEADPSDIF